jgi:hypothetical protein
MTLDGLDEFYLINKEKALNTAKIVYGFYALYFSGAVGLASLAIVVRLSALNEKAYLFRLLNISEGSPLYPVLNTTESDLFHAFLNSNDTKFYILLLAMVAFPVYVFLFAKYLEYRNNYTIALIKIIMRGLEKEYEFERDPITFKIARDRVCHITNLPPERAMDMLIDIYKKCAIKNSNNKFVIIIIVIILILVVLTFNNFYPMHI